MDKDGNECNPEDSYGCKVKYRLAYDRVSVTEKRFTLISLTALDGSPVMCILIISKEKPKTCQ